jgi:hypothetical protein
MDLPAFQSLLLSLLRQSDLPDGPPEPLYRSLIASDVSAAVILHFQNLSSCSFAPLSSLSIILLKQIFSDTSLVSQINQEAHAIVSGSLFQLFQNSQFSSDFLRLVSNACAVILPQYFALGMCLDFPMQLLGVVQGLDPVLAPAAIDCIVQCRGVFGIDPGDLIGVIAHALANCVPVQFLLAALRLLFGVFELGMDDLLEFAPAVARVYGQIGAEELPIALSDLCLFCLGKAVFFRESLGLLVESITAIVSGGLSEQIRSIAVDVLLALAKAYGSDFSVYLPDTTMAVMTSSCYFSDADDPPYSDNAILHLSEMFCLTTNYASLVLQAAREFAGLPDPRARRSAIVAIDRLIASRGNTLEREVDDLVGILAPLLRDSDAICRTYAFSALALLCHELGELVGPNVLQATVEAIEVEAIPLARIAEIDALSAFCEANPGVGSPLIPELLALVQRAVSDREQIAIVSAIVNIADPDLDQFYGHVMPYLRSAFGHLRTEVLRLIGRVFRTVRVEICAPDAEKIVSDIIQIDFARVSEDEMDAYFETMCDISEIAPALFAKFLGAFVNVLLALLGRPLEPEEFDISCDLSALRDRVWRADSAHIIAYRRDDVASLAHCFEAAERLLRSQGNAIVPMLSEVVVSAVTFEMFPFYQRLQIGSIRFLRHVMRTARAEGYEFLSSLSDVIVPSLPALLSAPFRTSVLSLAVDLLCEAGCPFDPQLFLDLVGRPAESVAAQAELEWSLVCLARSSPSVMSALPPAIPIVMRMFVLADMLPSNPDLSPVLNTLVLSGVRSRHLAEIRAAFFAFAAHPTIFPIATIASISEAAVWTLDNFVDDEDDSTLFAIDGAAVALGALILQGAEVNTDALGLWLTCLPIRTDAPEAEIAYTALLAVYAEFADMERMRTILLVAADLLGKTRISGEFKTRFRAVVGEVLSAAGTEALRSLRPPQRWALRVFLSDLS